jgi:hypothetical protein
MANVGGTLVQHRTHEPKIKTSKPGRNRNELLVRGYIKSKIFASSQNKLECLSMAFHPSLIFVSVVNATQG